MSPSPKVFSNHLFKNSLHLCFVTLLPFKMLCKARSRIFYFCWLSVSCWDITFVSFRFVCLDSGVSHHRLSVQLCWEHRVQWDHPCRTYRCSEKVCAPDISFILCCSSLESGRRWPVCAVSEVQGESEPAFTMRCPLQPLNPSDGKVGGWWEALRKARNPGSQSFTQDICQSWNFWKILEQKWHSL